MDAKDIDKKLRDRIVAGQKKFGMTENGLCKNEKVATLQLDHPRCADGCMCSSSVAWREQADKGLTELGL